MKDGGEQEQGTVAVLVWRGGATEGSGVVVLESREGRGTRGEEKGGVCVAWADSGHSVGLDRFWVVRRF